MRRQFLLASVGAIALTGSAFAAEPAPLPPPVPIFSWTGLYIGGQIGGAWDKDTSTITVFDPVAGTAFLTGSTANPSGVIGGGHLGYNLQIGPWVAGIEGTIDGTSIRSTSNPFFGFADQMSTPIQGSIQAHAGYAFDRVLIYATGGAAFAGIDNTYSVIAPGTEEKISRTRSGWTVGGGIAYALTNNWSIRAEYRYSDFGHYFDFPFAVFVPAGGLLQVQHHLTENQVQFGVSYNFAAPPAPVVAKY